MKLNILPSKGGGIMFPAFDYNHEKDEYRNGYDNGQGDKGYDDGENEEIHLTKFSRSKFAR